MLFFIYQTTNLVNGKIYIGAHKAKTINDSYLGSGDLILKAIKKHGRNSFRRDIVAFFSSNEELYKSEALIINTKFLCRKDIYNTKLGGVGGWNNADPKIILSRFTRTPTMQGKKHRPETIEKMKRSHAGKPSSMKGKKHKPETIEKLQKAVAGKIYVFSRALKFSKQIRKEELSFWLDKDWEKGRRIKHYTK